MSCPVPGHLGAPWTTLRSAVLRERFSPVPAGSMRRCVDTLSQSRARL